MRTLLAELALFLRTHKKLMLVPLILVIIGTIVIVVVLARHAELAPMIYTLNIPPQAPQST